MVISGGGDRRDGGGGGGRSSGGGGGVTCAISLSFASGLLTPYARWRRDSTHTRSVLAIHHRSSQQMTPAAPA